MGRPPCCEKIGMKKGPWTPEEDIILVSYIQEHGPGNWRAVPTNTGLLRCSKSCRLRWTNYLRPGIKRGNFTDREEKIIIHLQALLGNRWAAIASYLPERTDNDIKNHWNTHLKKKLRKLQSEFVGQNVQDGYSIAHQPISKGQWERRLQTDIKMAKQALFEALSLDKPKLVPDQTMPSVGLFNNIPPNAPSSSSSYASSAENIARLLDNFMKKPPKLSQTTGSTSSGGTTPSEMAITTNDFETLFGFNSLSLDENANFTPGTALFHGGGPDMEAQQVPLTLLEKWLFEDGSATQGQEKQDLINMSFKGTAGTF